MQITLAMVSKTFDIEREFQVTHQPGEGQIEFEKKKDNFHKEILI